MVVLFRLRLFSVVSLLLFGCCCLPIVVRDDVELVDGITSDPRDWKFVSSLVLLFFALVTWSDADCNSASAANVSSSSVIFGAGFLSVLFVFSVGDGGVVVVVGLFVGADPVIVV